MKGKQETKIRNNIQERNKKLTKGQPSIITSNKNTLCLYWY